MKVATLLALWTAFYFIKKYLFISQVESQEIKGQCLYQLYPMFTEEDGDLRCVYCVRINVEKFTLVITTNDNSPLRINELSQHECRKHECQNIINATTYHKKGVILHGELFVRKSPTNKFIPFLTIRQIDTSPNIVELALLLRVEDYKPQFGIKIQLFYNNQRKVMQDTIFQFTLTFIIGYIYFISSKSIIDSYKIHILMGLLLIIEPFKNIGLFGYLWQGTSPVMGQLIIIYFFIKLSKISHIQTEENNIIETDYLTQFLLLVLGSPIILTRIFIAHFLSQTPIVDQKAQIENWDQMMALQFISYLMLLVLLIYTAYSSNNYRINQILTILCFSSYFCDSILLIHNRVDDYLYNETSIFVTVTYFAYLGSQQTLTKTRAIKAIQVDADLEELKRGVE